VCSELIDIHWEIEAYTTVPVDKYVKISRENFRSASNSNKKGKLAFGLGELERQTDECYDIKTLPI
jgi:hypothetical protein